MLNIFKRWPIIVYKSQWGDVIATQQVAPGGTDTPPAPPAKNGYVFTGWSGSYTNVTADTTTVTAQYRAANYTVVFDGNGATGGSMEAQTFVYDAAQNLRKNGFINNFQVVFHFNGNGQSDKIESLTAGFSGWATSAAGGVAYANGAYVKNLAKTDGATVTLYAKWASSGAIALPIPTVPAGKNFLGWYTAASGGNWVGEGGASYTPSSSMDIYAHWSASTYSVRYNPNGGAGTMADTALTYGTDGNLRANAFVRTGYSFAGWATSAGGSVVYGDGATVRNLSGVQGAVVNLYAVWTANTYTVTFVPGENHTVADATKQVTFGAPYGDLPDAASSVLGEVFAGWFLEDGTRIDKTTTVATAANHSLYARFATGSYTVRFEANGGSGVMANMSFEFGETKALAKNAFTRTNVTFGYEYRFLGWSLDANAKTASYADGQSVSNLASAANETVVLYAVWRGAVRVTVKSNDTTLGTVSDSTGWYQPGTTLTIEAAVLDASSTKFTGWYVDGVKVSASAKYTLTVPDADCTYEARFKNVLHKVYIPSFNAAYGSAALTVAGKEIADISQPVSCREGDTIGLKLVPAYNYNANGWQILDKTYSGSECSLVVSDAHPETIECIALFTEKPKFTFVVSLSGSGANAATLTANDGYGNRWSGAAGDSLEVIGYVGIKYTATVALPNDDSTYSFEGWEKDGSLVESAKKSYSFTNTTTASVALVAKVHSAKHVLNIISSPGGLPAYGYLAAKVGDTPVDAFYNILVTEGQWITVTATPSAIRNFARWEVDGIDDSIEREYRFQITSSMPETVYATAFFETKSRSTLSAVKENGGLGTIDVSYTDVLNADTGTVGEHTVYLTKDSAGEVHDDLYAGVVYTYTATVSEYKSTVTGNQLSEFGGWYAKRGEKWAKQTSDLVCKMTDTEEAKAVFAYKTLVQGTISVSGGRGAVSISENTQPDIAAAGSEGPKWLVGRSVTLVAAPEEGYTFSFWRIVINGVPQSSVTNATLTLSPTADFTATAMFETKKCPVTLTVDQPSRVGMEKVHATVDGREVDDLAMEALVYGTVVVFHAEAREGYGFDGWYADGVRVSQEADYTAPALTDKLDIVAKFSATLSLSLSMSETAAGTVAATTAFDAEGNPIDFPAGAATATATVVLGGKCGIRVQATQGAFGAWYKASDTALENPLEYESEDTVVVSDNLALVARLVNADDYTYIALFNGWKNEDEREDNVILGILSLTKGETVDESVYNDGIKGAGYTGAAITGAYAYYRFLGVQRSRLKAVDNSGRTFAGWKMQMLDKGSFTEPSEFSDEQETDISTRFNCILTAYWGTPKPVRIAVGYCEGSRGCGSLTMSGATDKRVSDDNGITDEIMQGVRVTIGANVANGYMFVGWYRDSIGEDSSLVSREQSYAFTVDAQQSFYAKFAEDRNAIYKWEGSDVLKTLRWKSKTYVSNHPLDFAGARVDATDYSVRLKVEMFSSPDKGALPKATKEIEIRSQDARRLVHKRPEKFCALTVEADSEIDAIVVGTSMEGLAV